MQDHSVVEAIVAGDRDGIAGAYDRYAASLYAYCCSMLARPEAAEALLDTFIAAAARLDGLADPGRLEAWLHAVARNECVRLLQAGATPAETGPAETGPAGPGFADPGGELPAVTLPAELRDKVLTACTDSSPAGRALRMSVAHRAGPFGPTGFPKAAGAAGPLWWRRVRRHPRVVVTAAVLVVVAMSAGIAVIMTVGGAHRAQASALALGGGVAVGSASGAAPGGTAPAAANQTSPSPGRPTAPTTSPPVTPSAGSSTGRGTPARPVRPSPAASSPSSSPPPSPSPSPSLSPSPSTSASPAQGSLLAAPDKLVLVLQTGKPASGVFLLTAVNGPVSAYTIKVPAAVAGRVTVSPAHGSLPAGGFVSVTVTVTGKTALTTNLTVEPGSLIVQVVVKL
jgi:DNA-directed RNA polymerase specialized sigma24 family protein